MFRKTFSKVVGLQLNRSTCTAIKVRMPMPSVGMVNRLQCQKYAGFSVRTFATLPSSAVIKPASADNGIDISEKAVKQLKYIQKRDNDQDQLLRVLVDSGGCHGYQNKMELTSTVDEEEDTIFEKDGVRIVIDNISLQFLRGSVVDYVQELIGSTFQVVDNPNAKHSCGCNISYDIDLDKIY